MKEPGTSRLFILVCVAVLLASYGIGLGIKKIRFAGVGAESTSSAETAKPDDKPESDDAKAVADKGAPAEPSEQVEAVAAEPAAEPNEDVASEPQRPGGRRAMMGQRMGERFQNMSDQERQEAIARMRERFGGRARRAGPLAQLSEQDREKLRAEMEELAARAGEMTDDQRRQARNEILEKYGIDPEAGRGGRRRSGGGGGGAPPVKGRACFVPQTPVWVDGKILQIAKVTAGRTIGMSSSGTLSVAQLQEHEGTFECRDVVLESGETIGVVGAHCFMLESGKWVAAQNLTAGLRLKTLTGTIAISRVAERTVPYTGKVYNLKVNDSDRYFVGKDVIIVRDY